MRVNIAIPEAHVSKPVLDAALEAVTRLNEQLIKEGAPTGRQLIEQGFRWKPEPPGQEHFDHAGILAHRGFGDCDDIAPAHAAGLRATGEDPGAKAEVVKSGPHTWHAIVRRSNGQVDDPSKAAGMPDGGVSALHGAVLPLMNRPAVVGGAYIIRPSVAVRPAPQGYQARVDLPWHWRQHLDEPLSPTEYALTALHTAPVAHQALVGACHGAVALGHAAGVADPDHCARLAAIAAACEGCPPRELVEMFGPEHAAAAQQVVGSFFGDLFGGAAKAVTSPLASAAHFIQHPSLANLTHIATDPFNAAMQAIPGHQFLQPIAQMAQPFASFIPGVGPIASSALDAFARGGLPSDPMALAAMAMRNMPGAGMFGQALPFFQQAAQAWPAVHGFS